MAQKDFHEVLTKYARKYYTFGWNLVPLFDYSKSPATGQEYHPIFWEHPETKERSLNKKDGWTEKRGWWPYTLRKQDPEEVKQWIYNELLTGIGVITGQVSNLTVVDEDSYKVGGKTFTKESPLISQTVNGGKHHYFKFSNSVNTTGLQKGVYVEIKSSGGFIVLPPSMVRDKNGKIGKYSWVKDSIASIDLLPTIELADVAGLKKPETEIKRTILSDLIKVELGEQHNNLRTFTNSLLSKHHQQDWEKFVYPIVRQVAEEYDPPHPTWRVEKIIQDCSNFIIKKRSEKIAPKSVNTVVMQRIQDKELEKDAPMTGYPSLDLITKGFIPGRLFCLSGLSNVGKCFGKNTKVLMFDGTYKYIQDILVGDILMGHDGKERKVILTHNGYDQLYEIKQKYGENYIVNSQHILSLKYKKITYKNNKKPYKDYQFGRTINLSIEEYLKSSQLKRNICQGWKVGWQLPKNIQTIDPYFLGIWLGDGDAIIPSITITTSDQEVVEYLDKIAEKHKLVVHVDTDKRKNKAKRYRLSVKRNEDKNELLCEMRKYELDKKKYIPKEYMLGDRNSRLQLLAGLIDSDGYKAISESHKKTKRTAFFEITQKRMELAEDIFYLSSSLGFKTTIKQCVKQSQKKTAGIYYRVSIYGNITKIPTKIKRKKITKKEQITKNSEKGYITTPISINSSHYGEYYGISVDKDSLFMLYDGTVVHNTMTASNFAVNVATQDRKVLYFALEPDANIVDYLASVQHSKRFDQLKDEHLMSISPNIEIYTKDQVSSVKQLGEVIRNLPRYDLIIIDHIGYFIKGDTQSGPLQEQENITKVLAGLAKEKKTTIMFIVHMRKKQGSFHKRKDEGEKMPTMDELKGSSALYQDSTDVIFVTRAVSNNEVTQENYGKFIVVKTKSGKNGIVPIYFHDESAKITEQTEASYDLF